MSTLEVERAALAPYRNLQALRRHDSREGKPLPQRNYTLPCQATFPGLNNRLLSLHLVPGGRFLFTFMGDGVYLWDLGTALGSTLEVHQIDPVSPDPTFQRVRHLEVPHERHREIFFDILLTQDTVHLYCEPFYVVWNWVNNTGCKWNLRRPLSKISVCNESIIAADIYDDIGVWDVPAPSELPSLTGLEMTDLQTIENSPKYSFSAPRDHKDLSLLRTSTWQQNFSSDRHLCAISQRRRNQDSLALYSIKSVPGFSLKTLPVPAGRCGLVYGKEMLGSTFESGASAINRINDHLIFCTGGRSIFRVNEGWCERLDEYGHLELVATVLPIPDPSKPALHEIKPKSVILTPEGHDVISDRAQKNQFAFCPFSGRLVYMAMVGDRENSSVELRIADYLWTPTR
ncbi:hypothetical protein EST38_g5049 [Candolleomyces aberdarensis]|uniref:Uncharacterized protein n=1 Tax=Candolleomyces aberdarensis TaxID=2316362 RepID=A0A4Q2DLI2_9AGAR|nr:hypothetical protein EST38_g5049 [Candolleomyces aberdarensis]